jgi:FkbM family methyltransferase
MSHPNEKAAAFEQLYETYFGSEHLEQGEIAALPGVLRGCEVFIDAGASLGMYTYYANEILEGATIVAIEADPDRFAELSKNCEKWRRAGRNEITAVNAVVAEAPGEATFFNTGSTISGSLFRVEERAENYQAVTVPQVTLDQYHQPGRRTVVKLDIEGAEGRALEGAVRHLEGAQTDFLVELHWWGDRERGQTSLDVLRTMYRSNMRCLRPANEHKSHLHFQPAAPGELLMPGYVWFGQSVVAKAMYGKYAPKAIRDLRETWTRRRRRAQFGRPEGRSQSVSSVVGEE